MIFLFHRLFISSPFISHSLINTHWYANCYLCVVFSLSLLTCISSFFLPRAPNEVRISLEVDTALYYVQFVRGKLKGSWVSYILSAECLGRRQLLHLCLSSQTQSPTCTAWQIMMDGKSPLRARSYDGRHSPGVFHLHIISDLNSQIWYLYMIKVKLDDIRLYFQ